MKGTALLIFLVRFAVGFIRYVVENNMIEEGEARAILKLQEDTNERLSKVAKARADSAADSANGGLLHDDGHRRD